MSTPLLLIIGLPAACYAIFPYFWRHLWNKLLSEQTAIPDLSSLGQTRLEDEKIKGAAVICGGSIAGLLTARVCHNHFQRVVIVEPEAWLATEEGYKTRAWTQKRQRTRVMQYYSLQAVQAFFFMALKVLFPNVEEECKASDIRVLPADLKGSTWGHPHRAPYDEYNGDLPKSIFSSRQGLETLIRRLVVGKGYYSNIDWVVGTVTGIMADPENSSRVKKVSIRTPSGTKEIEAALVVDCTGPARVGVKMLERAGYGNAESYSKGTLPLNELKVTYDQKIRYSTFDFPIPSDLAKRLPIPGGFEGGGAVYATLTEPGKDRRSIYASRVDGDRLQICFGTWADDDVPRTLQTAKEYMSTMVLQLPPPEWFSEMLDMLAEVEDRMTFSVVHVPPTSYIRFHQAVSLPSNWVAIGDSVMRINPVFGQGCSKALIGAITLNTALHEANVNGSGIPSDFSKHFFKLQKPKIEGFWEGTKNYDYSYDTTVPITGETLTTGAILRWYMRRLQILALTDNQASSAFWHSGMMLSPGITVFQPLIVMKILWSLVVQRCT